MNGIKVPAKVRNIKKIERKKQPALVFFVIKIRKVPNLYVKKHCKEKHVY